VKTKIERRKLITLLGGAAAAWPLVARAQQAGKLSVGDFRARHEHREFSSGDEWCRLPRGRDFVIEARFAHRDYGRFPALVEELLSAKVVLIVTGGPASRAAPFAEKSVPVVFGFSGGPLAALCGSLEGRLSPLASAGGWPSSFLRSAARRSGTGSRTAVSAASTRPIASSHGFRGSTSGRADRLRIDRSLRELQERPDESQ
jgi:hypothetical protein